jgi:hypothetical protein
MKRQFHQTTHPDIATLVDPLSGFAVKRVRKFFFMHFHYPLSAAGEERGWSSEAQTG